MENIFPTNVTNAKCLNIFEVGNQLDSNLHLSLRQKPEK